MDRVARHALDSFGQDVEVLLALARMYLAANALNDAEQTSVRATVVAPDEGRAWRLLGEVMLACDDLLKAEQALERAIGAGMHDPSTMTLRARAKGSGVRSLNHAMPGAPESYARPARGSRDDSPTAPPPDDAGAEVDDDAPTPLMPQARTITLDSPGAGAQRRPTTPPASERRSRPPEADPRAAEVDVPIAAAPPRVTGSPERESRPPDPAPSDRRATGRELKLLDPNDERRRIDRYELIGEIASGGMATVFLARLAGAGGFQRLFAIKRLHAHLAGDEEFVQMFLDEARLAAGIHDPHVVPIFEVGTNEAGYYFVMEYVEGCTLARMSARSRALSRRLPVPIAVRVMLDVLAGLSAAHELADREGQHLGLVHRDCTPQNILVGADGASRITDFGIASAAAKLSITNANIVKGTLAYLSPEQARAEAVDGRSDLFAVGVVLWELLSGQRLFRAETEAKTLSRVLLEPIPALRAIAPELSTALEEVCARALRRDRGGRFQSANEMAEALELAARDAPGDTAAPGVASPREVGAYVVELFGAELAERRQAVRQWVAATGDTMPPSRPPEALQRRSIEPPRPSADASGEQPAITLAPPSSSDVAARKPPDADLALPAVPPALTNDRRFVMLAVAALTLALFAAVIAGWLYLRLGSNVTRRSQATTMVAPPAAVVGPGADARPEAGTAAADAPSPR
jgi:serine/threonine-protein kinase